MDQLHSDKVAKSPPVRFRPARFAAPLRSVLSRQKNTRVLLADGQDVDPVAKRAARRWGQSGIRLLVASGSQAITTATMPGRIGLPA
jgi:hypothetical protein